MQQEACLPHPIPRLMAAKFDFLRDQLPAAEISRARSGRMSGVTYFFSLEIQKFLRVFHVQIYDQDPFVFRGYLKKLGFGFSIFFHRPVVIQVFARDIRNHSRTIFHPPNPKLMQRVRGSLQNQIFASGLDRFGDKFLGRERRKRGIFGFIDPLLFSELEIDRRSHGDFFSGFFQNSHDHLHGRRLAVRSRNPDNFQFFRWKTVNQIGQDSLEKMVDVFYPLWH